MTSSQSPTLLLTRRKAIALAAAASSTAFLATPSRAVSKPTKLPSMKSMDIERFVADCVSANEEADTQAAVTEVLTRAVSDPGAALSAIGEPERAGLTVLHRSKTLTIFSAAWTPQMNLMPHNHFMWASIGIYTGREDNIFWRNKEESIEAFGADALFAGDVAALPADAIHSVTNPLQRFTGGIHIYGGDFFDTTRDQWNPETLDVEPSDGAVIKAIFERENQRLQGGR